MSEWIDIAQRRPPNHIGVILAFRWGTGSVVDMGWRDGDRYYANPRGMGAVAVQATLWQPLPDLPTDYPPSDQQRLHGGIRRADALKLPPQKTILNPERPGIRP